MLGAEGWMVIGVGVVAGFLETLDFLRESADCRVHFLDHCR